MLTLLAGLFFSGFFLDLDGLLYPVKALSWLLPVTYGIRLLQDVMLRGIDPAPRDIAGVVALVVVYGGLATWLLRQAVEVRMNGDDERPPGPGGTPAPVAGRARLTGFRRAVLNRRSLGRTIMVAAVVAAITCLVGIVVAWRLVGELADTTRSTLVIVGDTLATVDDTLDVADSVIESVDGGIGTIQDSLDTMSTTVNNGAAALSAFADLTDNLAPNLEQVDNGLGNLQSAVDVVDGVLRQLSDLPFGPDYDPETGLAASVQAVRDDLQPIADDLTNASGTLSDLASSSDEVIDRLDCPRRRSGRRSTARWMRAAC